MWTTTRTWVWRAPPGVTHRSFCFIADAAWRRRVRGRKDGGRTTVYSRRRHRASPMRVALPLLMKPDRQRPPDARLLFVPARTYSV